MVLSADPQAVLLAPPIWSIVEEDLDSILEGSMDQPTHVQQAETYVISWHFKAEDREHGRDCVLIATMLGDEMQAISLHTGHLPDESPTVL